eukprot:TRINITY_DN1715_c0_g1_i2.p1 TRINITY_DN1715_c0_g1~~TRINITY_DN1715_c0_g1_i2.p1  ORF type:complete len:468 (+),score=104.23 TRINITY_DN1715_c0_g1_i2:38-1441(+)
MGEDSDAEDAEVEEEEEIEDFQEIDVSGMEDGKRSMLLGGVSVQRDIKASLEICKEEGIDTLIVGEGSYESLVLDTERSGLLVIGNGTKEDIVFNGCDVSCTCYVSGITFNAQEESALKVVCTGKLPPRPVFTDCTFSGGKNVVAVHACAEPTLVGCTITSSVFSGVYCFPRSAPVLMSSYAVLTPAPFYTVKPPPGSEAAPATTLPPATAVRLVNEEPAEEDGTKYWRVTTALGASGYVKMENIDYTEPKHCTVTGGKAVGSVGVFCDDSKAAFNNVVVKGHETGYFLQNKCGSCSIKNGFVEDITGTGLYLSSGCRAVIKNCRVRKCKHYGLIVGKGKTGGGDQISVLCRELENFYYARDGEGYGTLLESLKEQDVTVDMASRTWSNSGTSEQGTWTPAESRPILRDNVFNANVRIDPGTAPSFFGNVIVKPFEATSRNKFSLNGIEPAADEPKMPILKREEPAE